METCCSGGMKKFQGEKLMKTTLTAKLIVIGLFLLIGGYYGFDQGSAQKMQPGSDGPANQGMQLPQRMANESLTSFSQQH